jgi:hypothetical protein
MSTYKSPAGRLLESCRSSPSREQGESPGPVFRRSGGGRDKEYPVLGLYLRYEGGIR